MFTYGRANRVSSPTLPVPGIAAAAALSVAVVSIAYAAYLIMNRQSTNSTDKKATLSGSSLGRDTAMPSTSAACSGQEVVAAAPPPAPLAIAPAASGSNALVLCPDGSEEILVAGRWAAESRGAGATVTVCPPGSLVSQAKSAGGSYDFVVVEQRAAGEGAENGSGVDSVLGEVLKLLKANGTIAVLHHNKNGIDEAAAATSLKRGLTFAGFVTVRQAQEDPRVVLGERPAWEVGACAPVRLSFGNTKKNPAANGGGGAHDAAASNGNGVKHDGSGVNGKSVKNTWKLALDDDEEDDGGMEDDLVDEDALLEASAPVVKRATETDAGGCSTKRRACKDCSCGRAEMEAAGGGDLPIPVVTLNNVDDVVTSACGNCSKGDAFRCATCPFLGKPAFEKGQEKLIMLSDLDTQQDV